MKFLLILIFSVPAVSSTMDRSFQNGMKAKPNSVYERIAYTLYLFEEDRKKDAWEQVANLYNKFPKHPLVREYVELARTTVGKRDWKKRFPDFKKKVFRLAIDYRLGRTRVAPQKVVKKKSPKSPLDILNSRAPEPQKSSKTSFLLVLQDPSLTFHQKNRVFLREMKSDRDSEFVKLQYLKFLLKYGRLVQANKSARDFSKTEGKHVYRLASKTLQRLIRKNGLRNKEAIFREFNLKVREWGYAQ